MDRILKLKFKNCCNTERAQFNLIFGIHRHMSTALVTRRLKQDIMSAAFLRRKRSFPYCFYFYSVVFLNVYQWLKINPYSMFFSNRILILTWWQSIFCLHRVLSKLTPAIKTNWPSINNHLCIANPGKQFVIGIRDTNEKK